MLPAFLASTVEFVEALTIVLAIGVSVNWKSSLYGALTAFLVLIVIVGTLGTAIVLWVPIDVLRVIVGIVLILFGYQWLKKAVLRYTGLKAKHDENKIFDRAAAAAEGATEKNNKFNLYGYLTSFKSVLLEGLEVAVIVITFSTGGSSTDSRSMSILSTLIGAAAALVLVVALGALLRRPLTKIPENTLKYIVGIMLVTFGTFWSGEGFGVAWPFSDLFLFILAAINLAITLVMIWFLARRKQPVAGDEVPEVFKRNRFMRVIWEIYDFICGDYIVLLGTAVFAVLVGILAAGGAIASALVGAIYIAGLSLTFIISIIFVLRRKA